MKNKKSTHSHHHQSTQYQQNQCPPLIAFKSYRLIFEISHHYPHTLSNNINGVESVYTKQAEKRLIIPSADTIIKKFAVMIELLSTSITPKTVMSIGLYLAIT
jgi:hypothetical protein